MSSYGARRQPFDSDGCMTAIGWGIFWIIILGFVIAIIGWTFTHPVHCKSYGTIPTYQDQSTGFGSKERVLVMERVCAELSEPEPSPVEKLWEMVTK